MQHIFLLFRYLCTKIIRNKIKQDNMAINQLNKYVWLVETIHKAKKRGGITLKEIQSRWLDSDLSEGTELSRRTFINNIHSIEELFEINIECGSGYRYNISMATVSMKEVPEVGCSMPSPSMPWLATVVSSRNGSFWKICLLAETFWKTSSRPCVTTMSFSSLTIVQYCVKLIFNRL